MLKLILTVNKIRGLGTCISLVRQCDKRTEANGFPSKKEAIEWAKKFGHEIVNL